MCGIFGQATNSPKKIDEAKIKILGIFNESRGRSSCGITYDAELYHGMDKDKLFSDFIKQRNFKPRTIPVVFGHTRQASNGAINEFNCHPFGFGQNKANDGYKFIMCHNGTLYNHKDLASDFGVSETEKYTNSYNVEITRYKIDSEILGEILYTSKNLKVLSKYTGRAALVWTDTDKPNVVYLWSGKSKPRYNDDVSKAEEERPLNVWIENKNSFFFSSLPDPLYAIGGTEKNVFQIDYNTVYVVTDGNFAAAKKILISRRDNFHMEYYGSYGRDNHITNGYANSRNTTTSTIPQRHHAFSELNKEDKALIQLPLPIINNIYDDRQIKNQNDYNGRVYTKQLRFWQNGHTIQGIHIFIPDYGYYYLGDTELDAVERVIKYTGIQFVDGDFDTHLKAQPGAGKVLFSDVNDVPKFYYFIEGVPVELSADYKRCLELKRTLSKGVYLDYKLLSSCSLVPVVQVDWTMKSVKEQGIMKDGELFSGMVDFLGFEKLYHIKDGNLDYAARKMNTNVCLRKKNSMLDSSSQTTNIISAGTNSRVRTLENTPSNEEGERYNPGSLEKTYDNITAIENGIIESELEAEVNNIVDPAHNDYDNRPLPGSFINEDIIEGKTMEEYIAENNESVEVTTQNDSKFLENVQHEDQAPSDEEVEEQIQCIINENLSEPLRMFQETKKDLDKHLPHPSAREAVKLIDDLTFLLETFIVK